MIDLKKGGEIEQSSHTIHKIFKINSTYSRLPYTKIFVHYGDRERELFKIKRRISVNRVQHSLLWFKDKEKVEE